MKECFERGGYEVMPRENSVAPGAAKEIIKVVVSLLKKHGKRSCK